MATRRRMVSSTDILPDRYARPRLIASGGMGRVFHAIDRELRREVAVKVLADRYADDQSVHARFRREALAAARLSGNPNIVTIFDVAEFHGRPMIVMEYLAGGSLEARVHGQGGCPPAQVLEWLEHAASALDAAHAAGVVHRDVKPANLLLDSRDHVHVSDFGIASAIGLDSLTEAGTILGTAGYLSPEQARGERATAASDRYSLAVVAFELLAGRRPFASDSATAEAARHATEPAPSIHAAKGELPPALDPVFARALAKDPAARYPTSAGFVGELRAALNEDAGPTAWIVPAPAPQRTAVTRVARPPAAAPARENRTLAPRQRWLLPLLLLLLIGGGVAAAVAATHGSRHPTAAPTSKSVTIVRTVTEPGQTIEHTVTAPAPPPPAAPTTSAAPPATQPVTGGSGAALNGEGYAKMRAGDYNGALPLLEQAVQQLTGTGSVDEAYADYNLAYTRYELGQCDGVLALLDRSQAIQGHRSEIDALRRDAQRGCG